MPNVLYVHVIIKFVTNESAFTLNLQCITHGITVCCSHVNAGVWSCADVTVRYNFIYCCRISFFLLNNVFMLLSIPLCNAIFMRFLWVNIKMASVILEVFLRMFAVNQHEMKKELVLYSRILTWYTNLINHVYTRYLPE